MVLLYWRKFLDLPVLARVITAFIPTGIIGFALYHVVKTYLLGSDAIVLWSLGLGGVALIVFELLHKEADNAVADVDAISYKQAALIGLFQSISMIPGVSRAGATIVGGLILGLSRSTIVEFSFLLAVPTMLAATLYDLYKNAATFAPQEFGVLAAGFIASFSCRPGRGEIPARLRPHQHLHSVRHLSHPRRARLRLSVGGANRSGRPPPNLCRKDGMLKLTRRA